MSKADAPGYGYGYGSGYILGPSLVPPIYLSALVPSGLRPRYEIHAGSAAVPPLARQDEMCRAEGLTRPPISASESHPIGRASHGSDVTVQYDIVLRHTRATCKRDRSRPVEIIHILQLHCRHNILLSLFRSFLLIIILVS